MSRLPPVVLIRAGGLETSQSCQSLGTSWKCFLYAPVLASRTTTEPVKRLSPWRTLLSKSGPGLPTGTYRSPVAGSRVVEVQAPPPLIGAPGIFFQVEVLSGEAPSGPRTVSPSVLGTRKNCHTILPVLVSSAYMRPLPPLKSPPALPMKTRPFHAIGAAGTLSPFDGSAIGVSQSRLPVLKSYASTRPSSVPRNRLPSR